MNRVLVNKHEINNEIINSFYCDYKNKGGITMEKLEEAFNNLIPCDKNGKTLVKYDFSSIFDFITMYDVQANMVFINNKNLSLEAYLGARRLCDNFGISNKYLLASYLAFQEICNVLEQVHQRIISESRDDYIYPQVRLAYYIFMHLDEAKPSRLRMLRTLLSKDESPVERNSKIESTILARDTAYKNVDRDIESVFSIILNYLTYVGYEKNSNGSIYNTLRRLGNEFLSTFNVYNVANEIPDLETRLRYGLPISEEERKRVRHYTLHQKTVL